MRTGSSYDMVWSSDSSTLAFINSPIVDQSSVYVVAARGGQPRRLTPRNDDFWRLPSWSPDGTMLVATLESARPLEEVWIMRKSGAAKRRLLSGGDSASWQPSG